MFTETRFRQVDERAQELIENLSGMDYRAVTYLHKTKRDWQSMFYHVR